MNPAVADVYVTLHPYMNSVGKPSLLFESFQGKSFLSYVLDRYLSCSAVGRVFLSLPADVDLPGSYDNGEVPRDVDILKGPGFAVFERVALAAMQQESSLVVRANADLAWPPTHSLDYLLEKHLESGADVTIGDRFIDMAGLEIYSGTLLERLTREPEKLQGIHSVRILPRRYGNWIKFNPMGSDVPPLFSSASLFLVDEPTKKVAECVLARRNNDSIDDDERIVGAYMHVERQRGRPEVGEHRTPKNVLLVNNVARIGGAENSLHLLALGLKRRGKVLPTVVLFEDGELRKRFDSAGISCSVISLANNHSDSVLAEHETLLFLKKIVSERSIDIIHCNSITANREFYRFAIELGLPFVTHIRDMVLNPHHLRHFRLHLPNELIAVSEFVSKHTRAMSAGVLDDSVVCAIHNGIDFSANLSEGSSDIRAELGLAANARLIGNVSQVNYWKGQDVLAKAFGVLADNHPDVHLVIVGDATVNPAQKAFFNKVKQDVRTAGLSDRVHFLGWRADVTKLLPQFDVFAHVPTKDDPFPRVVIEAMAAGCPVVGSESGGITEALGFGEFGNVVPMNEVAATARAIADLLDNPQKAKAFGEKSRVRAKRDFSLEMHVEKVEAVYQKALNR